MFKMYSWTSWKVRLAIRNNDRHVNSQCCIVCSCLFSKMWCLTTGPMIGISVVFANVFPSDRTAGVSSMICTVTNKSKSLTYAVAFLICLPFSVGCYDRGWVFWIHERFPVPLRRDLSCSACALRLRNLPQMFFHLVSFKDGAVRLQTSEGEKNAALSFL